MYVLKYIYSVTEMVRYIYTHVYAHTHMYINMICTLERNGMEFSYSCCNGERVGPFP